MAKGSVRKKGKKWYYRFYVEERDRRGELEQELLDGREAEVLLVLHLFKVV